MLDFTTVVDGVYVNTHRGDGLIVATPTGSTAYALSCGGPIIQPNVSALVMVPICPHTLSDRPLVLPSTSTIRVTLEQDTHSAAHVMCDGEARAKLGAGETVTFEAELGPRQPRSPPRARLAKYAEPDPREELRGH